MKLLIYTTIVYCLLSCNSEIKYPEGGYDYPKASEVTDTNFYYYPIRNIETKQDSLNDADEYLIYKAFDEPNLSIKPLDKSVFRLFYGGFKSKMVIITLSEEGLFVKQGNSSRVCNANKSVLTQIEQLHLSLMWHYPLNDTIVNKRPGRRRYNDSMIKLYPQLLDPKYFISLNLKTVEPNNPPFAYTARKIALSKVEYAHLANLINASGYWSFPHERICENPTTDGYSFILEANTKRKYNYVLTTNCDGETSKLTQACQELIKYAGMDKEVHLIWKGETIKANDIRIEETP